MSLKLISQMMYVFILLHDVCIYINDVCVYTDIVPLTLT